LPASTIQQAGGRLPAARHYCTIGWYHIILLGDKRCICVWTACPESLQSTV